MNKILGLAKTLGDKSQRGTKEMFKKQNMSRERYYDAVSKKRAYMEGKFFDEEEENNPSENV